MNLVEFDLKKRKREDEKIKWEFVSFTVTLNKNPFFEFELKSDSSHPLKDGSMGRF